MEIDYNFEALRRETIQTEKRWRKFYGVVFLRICQALMDKQKQKHIRHCPICHVELTFSSDFDFETINHCARLKLQEMEDFQIASLTRKIHTNMKLFDVCFPLL